MFREIRLTHESEQSPSGWHALPPVARIYVGSIIGLGGVAAVWSIPRISEHDALLVTALAMLSLVTSIAKVNLPVARSGSTLTICYVIDYVTLLLFGRHAATLVAAFGAWTQCTICCRQRAPVHQTLFSVATLAFTMQATGLAYEGLGGQHVMAWATLRIEAMMMASIVFFVLNSGLVAGAVGLSTRQSTLRVWVNTYLWSWPGYLLGFILAALVAAAIGASSFWLLPIALISLALTFANFKRYVERLTDSMTDALTDLPNVRFLHGHVGRELARSRRDGSKLALMLIDLDRFKSVNDTHGHSAGDLALRHVATSIRRSIRSYDLCARYGGDEFVVVLPGCGRVDAQARAIALRSAVTSAECETPSGARLPLSVSVGVAIFPDDGETFQQLLAVADAGMFQDKGANRFRAARRKTHPHGAAAWGTLH